MEIEGENKSLAFDLRTSYAAIITRKMVLAQEASEVRNYPSWLRELELLFMTAFSRVDKERVKLQKQYEKAHENVLKIINKYPMTYFRKDNEAKAVSEIEEALSLLQYCVYRILHISDQFGSNTFVKGLY